jgi:hypothetical protein
VYPSTPSRVGASISVYSRSATHFERIAGTDDGAMLLAAVTTVLDRSDRVALLERTRAEIQGLTITELCDAKGWHRGRFYRRTDAAAERVAAAQSHAIRDVRYNDILLAQVQQSVACSALHGLEAGFAAGCWKRTIA